jgi:hypothetical protein
MTGTPRVSHCRYAHMQGSSTRGNYESQGLIFASPGLKSIKEAGPSISISSSQSPLEHCQSLLPKSSHSVKVYSNTMRSQLFFFVCLVASVVAGPLPPRASPIIGVVIPSDIQVVAPKFDMGDSVERSAPAAVATPQVLAVTPSTGTVSPELRPGARFHSVGGHSTSTNVQAAVQPAAAMGDAISRKAATVQKRYEEEGSTV